MPFFFLLSLFSEFKRHGLTSPTHPHVPKFLFFSFILDGFEGFAGTFLPLFFRVQVGETGPGASGYVLYGMRLLISWPFCIMQRYPWRLGWFPSPSSFLTQLHLRGFLRS